MELSQALSYLIPIFIVIGPTATYYPQLYKTIRFRTVGVFSPLVCLILIVSNSAKVAFWYCGGIA